MKISLMILVMMKSCNLKREIYTKLTRKFSSVSFVIVFSRAAIFCPESVSFFCFFFINIHTLSR